jgi:hypothetical protein
LIPLRPSNIPASLIGSYIKSLADKVFAIKVPEQEKIKIESRKLLPGSSLEGD